MLLQALSGHEPNLASTANKLAFYLRKKIGLSHYLLSHIRQDLHGRSDHAGPTNVQVKDLNMQSLGIGVADAEIFVSLIFSSRREEKKTSCESTNGKHR